MSPPRIDYTISVGNLLTIGAGIIALVMAYGAMNAAVDNLSRRFDLYETGAQEREVRIRALELGAGRTEEKLLSILDSLDRIENSLGSHP